MLGVLAALVAPLVLVAPAAAARAADPAVTCGSTLTQDTVLTSDLTCTGDGLTILSTGITLDLAGHTIRQAGAPSGTGITVGFIGSQTSGVTVRNGTVTGFGTGVLVQEATDTTVSHVRLIDDAAGSTSQHAAAFLTFAGAFGTTLSDSEIRDSGWAVSQSVSGNLTVRNTTIIDGTRILVADNAMTMTHDAISDTSIGVDEGEGLTVEDSALIRSPISDGFFEFGAVTIRHNLIVGAADPAIPAVDISYPLFDGATIAGNVFAGNAVGLEAGGPLQQITPMSITDNAFTGNGATGALLQTTGSSSGGRTLTVAGNTFARNGFDPQGLTDSAGQPVADGLHVVSAPGSDGVIAGNATRFNASYGIYAQPGTVTDGGGNTSIGDPDGCLGVTCS